MPNTFFQNLQKTVDARRNMDTQQDMLKQSGRRLRLINEKTKNPALQDPDEDPNLDVQRRQALREYKDAKIESQLNGENLAKRERYLMALATPMG
jgi:hypothetical protein